MRKNGTKLLALFLALTLIFTGVDVSNFGYLISYAQEAQNGTCGDNLTYTLEDGVLTIQGSGAMTEFKNANSVPWKKNLANITGVVIGEGVTTVSKYAFQSATKLVSVELPDSLVKIGMYAFKGSGLTSVTIPAAVANTKDNANGILNSAFADCKSLTEITYKEGSLGVDGLVNKNNMIFQNCTSLKTISFPSTMESIGANNFRNCPSIENIQVAEKNGNFVSEGGLLLTADKKKVVLGYNTAGKEVSIPETVTAIGEYAFQYQTPTGVSFGESVTSIEKYAFYYCTSLTKVILPGTVTALGENAFANSSVQEAVVNANVKTLPKSMFNGCASLKKVVLNDSITSFGTNIFTNCKVLETVVMPKALTGVSSYTFGGCEALKEIYIPETVTNIGSYAFNNCKALINVYYGGTEEQKEKITISATKNDSILNAAWMCQCRGYNPEIEAPVMIEQPKSATYAVGDSAKELSVKVKGRGTYLFTWYKDGNYVKSHKGEDGLTSYCTPSTDKAGEGNYYCKVVKIEDGYISDMAVSEKAVVTVTRADMEGAGSETNPYLISGEKDLRILNSLVLSGEDIKGKYFKLTGDIELSDSFTGLGGLKEGAKNEGKGANILPFNGILDGDHHTITMAYGQLPLLNYAREATVKNVNIKGAYIAGSGLLNHYFVDYGEKGSYASAPDYILNVENVTVKSGTTIKGSGIASGYASGVNTINVKNCTVEKGVKIGYDADLNAPAKCDAVTGTGSIGGSFNGTVENCVSYATVYGNNYVGGILGRKGQAMGPFEANGCTFLGEVIADGNYAGGICGSGYPDGSAPNTPCAVLKDNKVKATVQGTDYVGGILGAEPVCSQAWDNGIGYIVNNSFTGTLHAGDGAEYVGGIAGYIKSLNKYTNVENNYYDTACGASEGIGAVLYVDTKGQYTPVDGVTYFNTEANTLGCPKVQWCSFKVAHNREDDPLGADKEKLTKGVSSALFKNGTVEQWVKQTNCYKLTVMGVPTTYYLGDDLDLSNAAITAYMTDGTSRVLSAKDIKITGYNKKKHEVQTVTFTYMNTAAQVKVTVLQKESEEKKTITVSFVLYGDDKHGEGTVHTLRNGGLKTWVARKNYTLDLNATVKELLEKVLSENNMTYSNPSGNYVESINGLGEFDNGKNSGWMYTLNGNHPLFGVAEQFLADGDSVVFHYTDDFTKEQGSEKWADENTQKEEEKKEEEKKEEKKEAVTSTMEAKVEKEVKVSADGTEKVVAKATLTEDTVKEIISDAKEKNAEQIKISVAGEDTKDAEEVSMALDKSTLETVVSDTKASIVIETPCGNMDLSRETMNEIMAQCGDKKIDIAISKPQEAAKDVKKTYGEAAVSFDATITAGDTTIHDFKGGTVSLMVPTPDALEGKSLLGIYEKEDGSLEQFAVTTTKVDGVTYAGLTTGHFSRFLLVDESVMTGKVTDLLTKVTLKAKVSGKKLTVTGNKSNVSKLKKLGYTVKYSYYRSAKKSSGYKRAATRTASSYSYRSGKKGKSYYYKVKMRVYDVSGKQVSSTSLTKCKYVKSKWRSK
ncbi:MAG: leucine-rich repeat protein [Lachnospiraceae bacterium]|nr:leucine-rich repeat protein [Lachnospiraceae bacterium]